MDALSDLYTSGQSGGLWVRDTGGNVQKWTAGGNTETLNFYYKTLYGIVDTFVYRFGSVGDVPDAASAAPAMVQITTAYGTGGTATPKSFVFEVR